MVPDDNDNGNGNGNSIEKFFKNKETIYSRKAFLEELSEYIVLF